MFDWFFARDSHRSVQASFPQTGNLVAILRSLTDSHVTTRICQYEALFGDKGLEAAKQFVLGKLRGRHELLKKYGLRLLDCFQYSE